MNNQEASRPASMQHRNGRWAVYNGYGVTLATVAYVPHWLPWRSWWR